MTETNVVHIANRLRDGRAVETDADWRQWFYEYFEQLTQDIGDHVPAEVFPIIVRVMVEWAEVVREVENALPISSGVETAQALADAVSKLSACLNRHLASMEK